MTVHFIGAGPGAADLITLRGLKYIETSQVCLYAGSLVPAELTESAPIGAQIIDTSSMHLDQIIHKMEEASLEGFDVARVHSGDPSIYGAIAEQMRRLDQLGIKYDVTPGVAAFAAAAAELKQELTLPEISQTVIVTRTSGKASAMPAGEDLKRLGATKATLAIHLSIRNLKKVVEDLLPHYGENCPVCIAYRVTWPDQKILFGTLSNIREKVRAEKITRTALILVGDVFGAQDFIDSKLYTKDHKHILRPK